MMEVQSVSQFSLVQSGYPFSVQNFVAIANGGTLTAAYTISGAPASLTIVVEGVKNTGQRLIVDTYSGTANTSRSISITDSYDYFVITPQWAGGNNVAVSVTMNFAGAGQNQTAVVGFMPLSGVGSPAGVVAAPIGTLYCNTTGSAGSVFFVKTSGGSTSAGWSAVA
jgi:hypothetical protein